VQEEGSVVRIAESAASAEAEPRPEVELPVRTAASSASRAPLPLILGLAFAIAYVILFEVYSGATFHESEKLGSVLRDLATLIPYLAPIVVVELVTRGPIRRVLLGVYLVAHAVTDLAFVSTRGHLDFAFIRDNFAEASSNAGASMVLGAIPTPGRVLVFVELFLLGWYLRRERPWRAPKLSLRARRAIALGAAGLFALAFVGRISTRDSLTDFSSSIIQYYGKNQRMADARSRTPGAYPFVHQEPMVAPPAGLSFATSPAERPNVVLVMMESFSAQYVGKTAPDGQPYTPTMNRLISSGISAPHFYGNSIQTCHGHFATLCSLVPSYRKKEAYIEPLSLECLPQVLRREGYATTLYEGDESEHFDGIDEFGQRLGFEETRTSAPATLTAEERAHVWGWGLQDDYFYALALRSVVAHKRPGRPFFLALAPVSNHYPFNEEPGRPDMPGEATTARAAYTASLRASDRRLERLFQLLEEQGLTKSTLVIVTGDHSFPADEHGSHWNERGFYEESFRVPLAMIWPGHLPPRSLDEGAFSQVDIAPTVLELLGIHKDVPFVGRSVFQTGPRFVPLVQPYDGQYLGAVAWPWKYREHGLTGEARILDLSSDPQELHPLPTSSAPPEVVAKLQHDVDRIHLNQALLQSNQIWPTAQ
jgi:phosphoglycerol transferase MdoB-like AlkP superfamily enzyme